MRTTLFFISFININENIKCLKDLENCMKSEKEHNREGRGKNYIENFKKQSTKKKIIPDSSKFSIST